MLSIIVCSKDKYLLSNLRENIEAKSCGYSYEIIAIDNSRGKYSIFSAYNDGIKKAKGDVLCFMHEDVIVNTDGWLSKVEDYFNVDTSLGCLGVIGDIAIVDNNGYVGSNAPVHYFNQYVKSNNQERLQTFKRHQSWYSKQGLCEVVVIDGVWFCIPRRVLNLIRFDDVTFDGFHMYDMDISMQVHSMGYKIAVTNHILISHYNNIETSISNAFYSSLPVFYKKWRSKLPIIQINNFQQLLVIASRDEDYSKAFSSSFEQKIYRFIKIVIHFLYHQKRH